MNYSFESSKLLMVKIHQNQVNLMMIYYLNSLFQINLLHFGFLGCPKFLFVILRVVTRNNLLLIFLFHFLVFIFFIIVLYIIFVIVNWIVFNFNISNTIINIYLILKSSWIDMIEIFN